MNGLNSFCFDCHKAKANWKARSAFSVKSQGLNCGKAKANGSWRSQLLRQVARLDKNNVNCNKAKANWKARSAFSVKSQGLNCGKAKLKGQLVFEFIVAVIVFLGIMFYILNYVNATFNGYREGFFSEDMENKAMQIAELLLINRGNWTGSGSMISPGLAEDWPLLNSTKISWFNTTCNSDYEGVMKNLGVHPRYRVKIVVKNESSELAKCTMGEPSGRTTEVRRFGVSDKGFITVSIWVWEKARYAYEY
ncbi:MAG: hypothetical protein QXN71_00440 [Candidatus Aenigmatarchaeota archaeon]